MYAEDDACGAERDRALARDDSHTRAARDTPASPPRTRARGVPARRSAPRESAAASTDTPCDMPARTGPRGRTGAAAAPDDALAAIPPRAADAGMGTPRARTGIAIAPVGGRACVRRTIRVTYRLGLSNEPRGFLAGVLTTARPARRAENGGSGEGLLKSFAPRGLHRAVA